jgi:hypothetical protein
VARFNALRKCARDVSAFSVQQDFGNNQWRHPFEDRLDDDEIEELLREERRRAILFVSALIDELPDCPEKWKAAFALGTTNCLGRSMSEVAAKLGVTRAIISYGAKDICTRFNLPPSPYMRNDRDKACNSKPTSR